LNNNILDGKSLAFQKKIILKDKLSELSITLSLAVILVGDDPASIIYIKAKEKACKDVGIFPLTKILPTTCSEEELLKLIEELNNNLDIHGILIQLPLPKHINTHKILESVDPKKDVDCFHPTNLGYLFTGISDFAPATAAGILMLIDSFSKKWQLQSKNILMIGASNIVGKPTAMLLLQKQATITIAHKMTINLKDLCLKSDLIISAVGVPNLITKDMVKENSILIDVGMNRIKNNSLKGYTLVGDMDFNNLKNKVLAITPVPGGVGPMTIYALLHNLYLLYQKYHKII